MDDYDEDTLHWNKDNLDGINPEVKNLLKDDIR